MQLSLTLEVEEFKADPKNNIPYTVKMPEELLRELRRLGVPIPKAIRKFLQSLVLQLEESGAAKVLPK